MILSAMNRHRRTVAPQSGTPIGIESYPHCRFFSSWTDQLPLAPAPASGPAVRAFALGRVQGLPSEESWFRGCNLESSQRGLSVSLGRGSGLGLTPRILHHNTGLEIGQQAIWAPYLDTFFPANPHTFNSVDKLTGYWQILQSRKIIVGFLN